MFILNIRNKRTYMAKTALGYMAAALFLGIFAVIYEHFSFGVYSPYMAAAYLIPLAGGALPALALSLYGRCPLPGWLPSEIYRTGIATLAMGSVFRGILDIYGTTNHLLRIYLIAGGALIAASVLMYLAALVRRREYALG